MSEQDGRNEKGVSIAVKVRLRGGARAANSVTFDVDVAVDGKPAPQAYFEHIVQCREAELIGEFEERSPDVDELREVGRYLWSALFSAAVSAEIASAVQSPSSTVSVALDVGPELYRFPWEALYRTLDKTWLGNQTDVSLVHVTAADDQAPRQRKPSRLSVLLVIPQGAALNDESEVANLQRIVGRARPGTSVKVLRGEVTLQGLERELRSGGWTLVHFIGHGRVREADAEIRFNDENGAEKWLNAEQLATAFRKTKVEVCVLNCCHGAAGRVSAMNRFAPALVAAGVNGVVAMRYAMDDNEATHFTENFYEELFTGRTKGSLGHATQTARRVLFQRGDYRGAIAPVVQLGTADDRFFELEGDDAAAPSQQRAVPVSRPKKIPEQLVWLVREKKCVVVVGTRLVPLPTERDATPGPSLPNLRGLVDYIRNELSRSLEDAALAPAEQDEPHMSPESAVSRWAERYKARESWTKLAHGVRFYYQSQPAPLPEVYRGIAKLGAPGLFYLHFDGLMETAYRDHSDLVVVSDITASPKRKGDLLVLVRGSIRSREIVLTEHDHFALMERVEALHSSIGGLTTAHTDRCLLFIGSTPGDAVTRHLARKLLRQKTQRDASDSDAADSVPLSYFVSPKAIPGDELFWKRFKTEFVRADPAGFVDELVQLVGAG